MKLIVRLSAALLAALMTVCMLAACGSEADAPETDTPSAGIEDSDGIDEVAEVYDLISELDVLPEMYVLDDVYIENYYGIALDSIENRVFAVADDPLLVDTVIIVEVSENGSADDIVSAFKAVNEQKMIELESYNPAQYERAAEAAIAAEGGYVYYIITDANDTVIDTVRNGLGL